MSETLPVIDMPVNIDMDVNKGKMLLEILQNAAKFNHGFSFGGGGLGGVPATPSTPGVPTGSFNPGAIPGAGSTGNGRGIASRAGNAMLNTVIAPFILLGKTTALTTKSVRIFGTALKKTTGALQGIFTSVLKWSLGLTAVAGGGMFGYSRLAKGVSNDFNASRGLGVSTAFNKAFNTVWGNKLDGAGEFLSAVSKAKGDPGSKEAKTLLGLGINPNGDVQANTMAALRSAWAFARQHKDSTSGKQQFDDLYGGLTLGGVGFNQLGSMNEKEYNEYQDMLAKQIKNNQISEQTQRSYQDLMIQLEGNMTSLGSTFVEMLKDLNPQIFKFSDAITKNLNEFMTGNGKDLFTEIGEGLEWFSGYISSNEFKTDIKDFKDSIRDMAGRIKYWLGIFGLIKNSEHPEHDENGLSVKGSRSAFMEYVTGTYHSPEEFIMATGRFIGSVFDNHLLPPMRDRAVNHAKMNRENTTGWFENAWGFLTSPPPMLQENDRYYQQTRKAMARGIRNNNPGNLKFAGQKGAVLEEGADASHARFFTMAEGIAALDRQVELYMKRGVNTIGSIFDIYAKGNRDKYKDYMSKIMGVDKNTIIPYEQREIAERFLRGIINFENGRSARSISDADISNAVATRRGGGNATVAVDINVKSAPGSDINTQVTSSLATASAMRFNGIPQ
ncbi:TPA: hypothetical protein QIF36_002400 [Enterobacter kobei]|nr:hypothetical protein [Enterobacter kobei]